MSSSPSLIGFPGVKVGIGVAVGAGVGSELEVVAGVGSGVEVKMGDEDNGGFLVGTEDDADEEAVTGTVGIMVGSVELTGGVGVGAKPGL